MNEEIEGQLKFVYGLAIALFMIASLVDIVSTFGFIHYGGIEMEGNMIGRYVFNTFGFTIVTFAVLLLFKVSYVGVSHLLFRLSGRLYPALILGLGISAGITITIGYYNLGSLVGNGETMLVNLMESLRHITLYK